MLCGGRGRLRVYGDSERVARAGADAEPGGRLQRRCRSAVNPGRRTRRSTPGRSTKASPDPKTRLPLIGPIARRVEGWLSSCVVMALGPVAAAHGSAAREPTSARRSSQRRSACRRRSVEDGKARHPGSRSARPRQPLAPVVRGCAPGWPCDCRWPEARSVGCGGSHPAGHAAGSGA